jgi:hypothetical protein
MKGLLIRVGIDLGSGGTLGPIFRDGSFEFIPIPECDAGKNAANIPTYGTILARSGGVFADYLPERLRTWIPHADPEFDTPTYGDPTTKKRTLRQLDSGDILFFHAGLQPYDTDVYPPRANYIVGYFTVDRVVDFSHLDPDGPAFQAEWNALQNNFHVGFRGELDTFIVVGDPNDSPLLRWAYPFTELRPDVAGNPTVAIKPDLEVKFELSGFVQRSTPRWMSDTGAQNLLEILKNYV